MINKQGINFLSINENNLTSKDLQCYIVNDFNAVRCDRQYSKGGSIAVLRKYI